MVEIKLDRNNLIAGIFPRISFVDRPSYTSSTREYDMVRFFPLGFPLSSRAAAQSCMPSRLSDMIALLIISLLGGRIVRD